MNHTLETIKKALKNHWDEQTQPSFDKLETEIFGFEKEIREIKQEWLTSSKDHPFPNCKTCTVEWINDLLGLQLDAEKEVAPAEELSK